MQELHIKLKDEFLSHVSHELRSPLSVVYQFSSILQDGLGGPLNPEQVEYLKIILKNCKQLHEMIDDLLEVTKAETGKLTVELECTSIAETVCDILDSFGEIAKSKGVALLSDIAATLPPVLADKRRIKQILGNLVDNSIKFTASGGAIKIHLSVFRDDSRFLLVRVSDTGSGIPLEVQEKIFDRLYQAPMPLQAGRKGLGLGLYICKELITRHHGRIWVTSVPEEGSTFSFLLPILSIEELLGPLLRKTDRPIDSIALVTVELGVASGSLPESPPEHISRAVNECLRHCVLPDLDVLLPKIESCGTGDIFVIVALANEDGAGVLARRIREQLQHLPEIAEIDCPFTVSHRLLDLFSLNGSNHPKELLSRASTKIEQFLNSLIDKVKRSPDA